MPYPANLSHEQAQVDASSREPLHLPFDNTYSRLPTRFYAPLQPNKVSKPALIALNADLAQWLGLDPLALSTAEGLAVLAGNSKPEGSLFASLAYAGHQFGYFVSQLGDGRAILLGEVVGSDGRHYDLQLKGSGPTPFSRAGDGRAALGPVLREYVVSEAMAAFGVPSTRALAAVLTGDPVYRETVQPGAVFTRVAASHLRVGTFHYFAARQDVEALQMLADYAIERHYPDLAGTPQRYRGLLEAVVVRQARLIAQWMTFGFVHGVMNTDNMAISGETLDYGPCAFMEAYDPDQVFSSIDRQGRYAYSNQPHAAHWNLTCLAEALLPLLVPEHGGEEAALEAAQSALVPFAEEYERVRNQGFQRKIGIWTEQDGDDALAADLLDRMAANEADFTLTFRSLCDCAESPEADGAAATLFRDPEAFRSWSKSWRHRLAAEPGSGQERAARMREVNPAFIPRNHRVEAMIAAAVERQDFDPFFELLDVVSQPYATRPEFQRYTQPAQPGELVTRTFCGT